MFTNSLKSLILGVLITAAAAGTAFAAEPGKPASTFPYEIEFDVEELGRICYAGHPDSTVQYKDGFAITPETSFRIVAKENSGPSGSNASDLTVTIAVVYENEKHSGSHRETIKEFNPGDLSLNEDYRIISENSAANLQERDKLFSNSLAGLELTLVNGRSASAKKKTIYLYVCSDDDYINYLENSESEDDLTEEDVPEEEPVFAPGNEPAATPGNEPAAAPGNEPAAAISDAPGSAAQP